MAGRRRAPAPGARISNSIEQTKAPRSSPACWLSVLVLCQEGSLQAAPLRSALESSPDPATLSEVEVRLLLAALVQDYVQMKASELEQEQEQETAPESWGCLRNYGGIESVMG
ncbi:calcitonin gene-related peptide 2-like [Pongo pygmaeus]|uniref:calcitonin gene-related peptide 2-like n=1 Tax=Pongo pygmaeus TaxID=9600 RepID=UPI0023E272FE|nr:calcitonin gene-related peptide 2-like [Pongo pygmaeus]